MDPNSDNPDNGHPDKEAEPFDVETFKRALKTGVEAVFRARPLPRDRFEKLIRFGCLLAETSQSINLTRILDPHDMAVRHFLDTYQLLRVLKGVRGPVLDVGTGGGIPGIPLAILRRDLQVVMIDGTAKKIRCLVDWIATLELKNAKALPERAEQHLKTNKYHALICRASIKPPAMMEMLIQTGPAADRLIFMEGAEAKERARKTFRAAKTAGYVFDLALPYQLPGLDKMRHLLCYRRIKHRPVISYSPTAAP
ncbi:MAG: 16S rRNA (guanine(527)-N(7))-methyltransferase RsmG [Planctomycetes bacterium]|nr:16S rRNA (guanine(527)-N(7))-methyltransferase RsmG [Planctomycetota bacterium]